MKKLIALTALLVLFALPVAAQTNQVVPSASSAPIYSFGGAMIKRAMSASIPTPTPTPTMPNLAYYLATNLVGKTAGFANPLAAMAYLQPAVPGGCGGPFYQCCSQFCTNWSMNFWLNGVQGKAATCIGYPGTNHVGYSYFITMISPRHYIGAHHVVTYTPFFVGTESVLFMGTNGAVYYRMSRQNTFVANSDDIQVGILDSELPASVGYLPVLPANYTNWIVPGPVQAVGVNQDYLAFGMNVVLSGAAGGSLTFCPQYGVSLLVSNGVSRNWTACADTNAGCAFRRGDSSDPQRLVIENQFVLLGHAHGALDGPDYAMNAPGINAAMHYLSTNNNLGTDYQLSTLSLTHWPKWRGF